MCFYSNISCLKMEETLAVGCCSIDEIGCSCNRIVSFWGITQTGETHKNKVDDHYQSSCARWMVTKSWFITNESGVLVKLESWIATRHVYCWTQTKPITMLIAKKPIVLTVILDL